MCGVRDSFQMLLGNAEVFKFRGFVSKFPFLDFKALNMGTCTDKDESTYLHLAAAGNSLAAVSSCLVACRSLVLDKRGPGRLSQGHMAVARRPA